MEEGTCDKNLKSTSGCWWKAGPEELTDRRHGAWDPGIRSSGVSTAQAVSLRKVQGQNRGGVCACEGAYTHVVECSKDFKE